MLIIKKSDNLSGVVKIAGSKNAILPIIASSLLVEGEVILENVPAIGDVYTFLDILSGIGARNDFKNGVLKIDCSCLKANNFDLDKIKKLRASILLLSPLLIRAGKISIPTPGGCNLGRRSIDYHLNGLKSIGYDYKYYKDNIVLSGSLKHGDLEVNAGLGVTSTENMIVANVLRKGKTTIHLSAIEPHIMNLIDFLRKAGASIFIRYDHTIVVNGVEKLYSNFEFEVISDYIQSGTYMIIGALLSKDFITIENARIKDLYAFISKLREAGVKIKDLGGDKIRIYRSKNLKSVCIQTNVFPSFPTDLQSPFAVLMTQSDGVGKIHEVLFEGRLNWLIELEKMGSKITLLNQHEALIFGKSSLYGTSVTSWDLRAGAAMLIAGFLALGETKITNVEYIYRGYDNLLGNLKSLGACIEQVDI